MGEPENGNGGQDSITVKAGPIEAKLRGRHIPNLLRFLIFLFLCAILGLGYLFSLDTKHEHEAIQKALATEEESQRETTYILTLSQDKREALNLAMPDSLRKRVRP